MADVLRVLPAEGRVNATVPVPGSKSIANRVLAIAALAEGKTTISNLPSGDDTNAMLAALRSLGLDCGVDDGIASLDGGIGQWTTAETELFTGLAGTTSRFVTALASLASSAYTVDGHPPLRRRPFGPLHDALRQLGVAIDTPEGPGTLPAHIVGPPTRGTATISGDISSQFVTALMLIGPHLNGGLSLSLTTPLVSQPYVELTAATMGWFGFDDVVIEERHIRVGEGRYQAGDVVVEPDASSASYPLAIAAICGGTVTVPGLGTGALQGDARFADVLELMGCSVDRSTDSVTVMSSADLTGIDIDMADISDLVPTMAVVAAFAATPTRIRGVGFIREKESDRLGDLSRELRSAGVDIDETDDGVLVRPSADRMRPARLGTHHDHRLAMAFGVLGARQAGIEVIDPAVVSKSWPEFWQVYAEHFQRPS